MTTPAARVTRRGAFHAVAGSRLLPNTRRTLGIWWCATNVKHARSVRLVCEGPLAVRAPPFHPLRHGTSSAPPPPPATPDDRARDSPRGSVVRPFARAHARRANQPNLPNSIDGPQACSSTSAAARARRASRRRRSTRSRSASASRSSRQRTKQTRRTPNNPSRRSVGTARTRARENAVVVSASDSEWNEGKESHRARPTRAAVTAAPGERTPQARRALPARSVDESRTRRRRIFLLLSRVAVGSMDRVTITWDVYCMRVVESMDVYRARRGEGLHRLICLTALHYMMLHYITYVVRVAARGSIASRSRASSRSTTRSVRSCSPPTSTATATAPRCPRRVAVAPHCRLRRRRRVASSSSSSSSSRLVVLVVAIRRGAAAARRRRQSAVSTRAGPPRERGRASAGERRRALPSPRPPVPPSPRGLFRSSSDPCVRRNLPRLGSRAGSGRS